MYNEDDNNSDDVPVKMRSVRTVYYTAGAQFSSSLSDKYVHETIERVYLIVQDSKFGVPRGIIMFPSDAKHKN